jgi:hypothetical protein
MAFWNSNDDDPGLIIWGQPWDLRNWELSEGFLRKWAGRFRNVPSCCILRSHGALFAVKSACHTAYINWVPVSHQLARGLCSGINTYFRWNYFVLP